MRFTPLSPPTRWSPALRQEADSSSPSWRERLCKTIRSNTNRCKERGYVRRPPCSRVGRGTRCCLHVGPTNGDLAFSWWSTPNITQRARPWPCYWGSPPSPRASGVAVACLPEALAASGTLCKQGDLGLGLGPYGVSVTSGGDGTRSATGAMSMPAWLTPVKTVDPKTLANFPGCYKSLLGE